ncbi:MAG: hypothetical protein D6727_03315 [Gammaproteobacteria bacterium]|nr:MAG: hypothetical protein D6727_03315 [Gammaproteobacteria bacterium]
MKHPRTLLWLAALLAGATLAANGSDEAERLQAAAEAADAAILAPQAYLQAVRALERARATTGTAQREQGVAEAARLFAAALDRAAVASDRLAAALAKRAAANAAAAYRLAPAAWERAERELFAAAKQLERGREDKAEQHAAIAAAAYDEAELAAIDARLLGEARSRLSQAKAAGAETLAPVSYERAQAALAEAATALAEDRSRLPALEPLAAAATREAGQALRIAALARDVRRRREGVEALVLRWESLLARLATAAGLTPAGDEDPGTTAAAIEAELKRIPVLEEELAQQRRQLASVEDELKELDQRVGELRAERSRLMRELQARARREEQFRTVEELFAPDEAQVLRDGDRLILRMLGLRFRSNSARLGAEAKGLLDRLRAALNVFPDSTLTIEGHTDASGDSRANLSLSERRAAAVADYLAESLGIPRYRLKVIGYGDSRPITSNRTAEGRARNRRIDIVLAPRASQS